PLRRGAARPAPRRARRRRRHPVDHALARGARRLLARVGERRSGRRALARPRAHHRVPQARAVGRRRSRARGAGAGHAGRRRRALEIMRLVGAPELVVRLPLLLQGMLQGLVGAVMAIWVLIALYTIAGPRLEPLVSQTLGLERLTFLRPQTVVALMFAGTMLGGFGGWLARGRTER